MSADSSPQDPTRAEQARKQGNELYQKGDLEAGMSVDVFTQHKDVPSRFTDHSTDLSEQPS